MGFEMRLKDGDFYYLNDDGEYVKVGSVIADASHMDISEKQANEYVEEICENLKEMTNDRVSWAREFDMFNGYWIAFCNPNIKTSYVYHKASMLMEEISECIANGVMARDIAYYIYEKGGSNA